MAARVLLVEDDASIARFVELALQELPGHAPGLPPVELNVVGELAAARAALAAGGWQLVISDLMLPDGSAETLLDEGAALAPGAPPWVVYSAGMHEQNGDALLSRGVARLLRKPVPLAELLDTVAELLAAVTPAGPPVAAGAPDPVQRHFGGDRRLYESFRAGCIERFTDDLAQGDAAVARADAPALRRVAHGLKAVLELLGQPALAEGARALEDAAAAPAPAPTLADGWARLAQGLVAMGARR